MTIQSDPVPSDLTDAEIDAIYAAYFTGFVTLQNQRDAARALIKRDRTLAPTRETAPALSDLKHAGDMLANCAFNLAQDGALSERARETLTQCRKAWDDARKADRAQQGVNPTMTREELVAAAESIGMRFAVFSGSFGDQPSPSRADREQRPAALSEATDHEFREAMLNWHNVAIGKGICSPEAWELHDKVRAVLSGADRARAITGEPVVWRYMMPGGVYHYTAYHDPEDPDCLTGEPLYRAASITGETSRDVAAEGGSPAPVQSTRDTPCSPTGG